jgi:hypothetical protein
MTPPTTLADLKPGQSAEVLTITSDDQGRLLQLAALGVAPGSLVRLQQRRPAFVIWAGETLLSLDGVVARQILIRPL